ncbi:MAG: hypothetical protein J3K34DRAFT_224637 [Monoraphidium minutum]|nr:MAG: hypothetical protein J3K34DRAFT_224637 [Monoraphidium minutum]
MHISSGMRGIRGGGRGGRYREGRRRVKPGGAGDVGRPTRPPPQCQGGRACARTGRPARRAPPRFSGARCAAGEKRGAAGEAPKGPQAADGRALRATASLAAADAAAAGSGAHRVAAPHLAEARSGGDARGRRRARRGARQAARAARHGERAGPRASRGSAAVAPHGVAAACPDGSASPCGTRATDGAAAPPHGAAAARLGCRVQGLVTYRGGAPSAALRHRRVTTRRSWVQHHGVTAASPHGAAAVRLSCRGQGLGSVATRRATTRRLSPHCAAAVRLQRLCTDNAVSPHCAAAVRLHDDLLRLPALAVQRVHQRARQLLRGAAVGWGEGGKAGFKTLDSTVVGGGVCGGG